MSPIKAGACWPQSACQTAKNFPSTSPCIDHRFTHDEMHSSAADRVCLLFSVLSLIG
jgi:hypothetical protein